MIGRKRQMTANNDFSWYMALIEALCDADKRQGDTPEIGGTLAEWRAWYENIR
jgi:hypothetical protein